MAATDLTKTPLWYHRHRNKKNNGGLSCHLFCACFVCKAVCWTLQREPISIHPERCSDQCGFRHTAEWEPLNSYCWYQYSADCGSARPLVFFLLIFGLSLSPLQILQSQVSTREQTDTHIILRRHIIMFLKWWNYSNSSVRKKARVHTVHTHSQKCKNLQGFWSDEPDEEHCTLSWKYNQ